MASGGVRKSLTDEEMNQEVSDVLSDKEMSESPFDSEGVDYDYETAKASGGKPDETGHWGSLDPRTGMVLKGRQHETWDLMEKEEVRRGNKIAKKGDRYYSVKDENSYQLSPNFHKKEFNQNRKPMGLDAFKVNPILIDKLEELRTAIGDKPIKINSGYRSSEYNKEVGGASKSQHLTGSAADIQVEGMTSNELNKIASELGFSFTQTYKNKPHLHVDVRGLHPKKDATKSLTDEEIGAK